ncbi:MAG: BON domain-containing protein [Bacteroidota bacterium]|nr:BON domain-containing protein [Bacteroidota bacterium]
MKSNLELQKDVQEELKREPSLIDIEIEIGVEDGIVTITGVVDGLSKKQAATDAVKQVAGVNIVINKIEVKDGELSDITKSTFRNFENIFSNTESSSFAVPYSNPSLSGIYKIGR